MREVLGFRRGLLDGEASLNNLKFRRHQIKQKRRKKSMKKVICLIAVALMVASVAFAAEKMMITAKDLPAYKGTWQGVIGFGQTDQYGSSPATLEILNDAVPVKIKLTIANVPNYVAQQIGTIQAGQNVFEGQGVITSRGNLYFTGAAGNMLLITPLAKGKINLQYMYNVIQGSGEFKMKK